jgi:spore maturation protein SpmB
MLRNLQRIFKGWFLESSVLFISVLKWISLATAVGIISFLITGHRSVYPSQVLASEKSSSLEVQKGEEMGRSRRSDSTPEERA